MAKFCTKCGRPLEEGEICTCQQKTVQAEAVVKTEQAETESTQPSQVAQQAQQAAQQAVKQVASYDYNAYFKKVTGAFIEISKKPVTAGAEFIGKADLAVTMFFIVIQGILTGLFTLVIATKIGSIITGLGNLASSFSSSSSKKNNASDIIKMPYFKGFILTVFISVMLTVLLALILYAANKVLKNVVTFKQMLTAASLRSIFTVYTTLFAIIVFLINPMAGIVCFFSGNLVGMFVIAMTLPDNAATKNLVPFIMAAAFFVFMIVSLFVISKCWTIYVPDVIKAGIGTMKNMFSDPSEFFESFF